MQPSSRPLLRPKAAPEYHAGSTKVSRSSARPWSFDDILDAVFFALAAVAALWFVWVLLGAGWHLSPGIVAYLLLFWVMLTYLTLPRLHQVLTWLYVPDYFIGRTRTTDGLLGDPVNLALLGDEEDLHEAFLKAGWTRADPITARSAWRIVVSSLLHRSYPAAPISTLTLFGRGQDMAYQKEVDDNPAQRHHIRIWHTPEDWVLPGGPRVDWLAAAAYDRAVGMSVFTFQVTHKIDANIDLERDFVVDDVMWACPQAHGEVLADFFTSYHSTNGGGDRVVTDGDLHILNLHDVVPDSSSSAALARARYLEQQARRSRPAHLLLALGLIAANAIWLIVQARLRGVGGVTSTVRQRMEEFELETGQLGDPTTARPLLWALAVGSVLLSLAIIVAAVAAWRGHPRGRITLMVLLSIKLVWDMARMSTTGVRDAPVSLIAASAIGVLALLALSSRECHLWERARKAERQQQRAARPRG